jgi:hypothetical protein
LKGQSILALSIRTWKQIRFLGKSSGRSNGTPMVSISQRMPKSWVQASFNITYRGHKNVGTVRRDRKSICACGSCLTIWMVIAT